MWLLALTTGALLLWGTCPCEAWSVRPMSRTQFGSRSLGESARQDVKKAASYAAAAAAALLALAPQPLVAAAAAPLEEEDFVKALSLMLTCREIMAPVGEYVKNQGYDQARTNVKYLLNQLQVERAATVLVRSSIDFAGNSDNLEEAQEVGSSLGNALIQLDSTIYTVIFIPGDDSGGPPPAAEKYLVMLRGYLKNVNKVFNTLISLGDEGQLARAKIISDSQLKNLPENGNAILFKKSTKKTGIA